MNWLITAANGLLSHASVKGPNGFGVDGPAFFVVTVMLVISTLSIASLVWVFFDARQRDKSGLLALLFILFTGWPLSFVWWLWLRPPLAYKK